MRGYSVELNGDVVPENGYFDFGSMIVGPRTEVTLYNRNNDVMQIHNGTDGFVKIVNIYGEEGVPENTPLTLRMISTPRDNSSFAKITQTGAVIPLTSHSPSSSTLGKLIILIILCVGFYYLYTNIMERKIQSLISQRYSKM